MGTFDYDSLIAKIPDFPNKGVLFRDIMPLIGDPEGFQALVEDLAGHFAGLGVTKVVGAEARGFMVGAPVAYKMGAGFVPARKPGKLPRACFREEYSLEYGTNALEMHCDAMGPDDKVVIVDDLVATGGTAVAMVKLIEQTGAQLVGLGFLLELAGFKPRDVIREVTDADFYSLVSVNAK
jgi:adenine phosphoribosyltransferase